MRNLLLVSLLAASACAPRVPPHWAEGGAPLVLPAAHWNRGDEVVELRPNGELLEDGSAIFTLDRVGRVVDDDYEAVALLTPDGALLGTDERFLGRVGVTNASPPGSEAAWLTVAPDGQVVFYDSDGTRSNGGKWSGCEGPALRTCTYATHLVILRNYLRRAQSGVTVGVGVGVGVGY